MKNDLQIRQEVLTRLELEAQIDPAQLRVSVENGVVTLTGTVEKDEDRTTTERAVRLLKGVKGLVDDDLQVESTRRARPRDAEIQAAALEAIQWLTTIPQEGFTVTARDGWLILQGQVESRHQAEFIEEVLRGVRGAHGVKNELKFQEEQQAA